MISAASEFYKVATINRDRSQHQWIFYCIMRDWYRVDKYVGEAAYTGRGVINNAPATRT